MTLDVESKPSKAWGIDPRQPLSLVYPLDQVLGLWVPQSRHQRSSQVWASEALMLVVLVTKTFNIFWGKVVSLPMSREESNHRSAQVKDLETMVRDLLYCVDGSASSGDQDLSQDQPETYRHTPPGTPTPLGPHYHGPILCGYHHLPPHISPQSTLTSPPPPPPSDNLQTQCVMIAYVPQVLFAESTLTQPVQAHSPRGAHPPSHGSGFPLLWIKPPTPQYSPKRWMISWWYPLAASPPTSARASQIELTDLPKFSGTSGSPGHLIYWVSLIKETFSVKQASCDSVRFALLGLHLKDQAIILDRFQANQYKLERRSCDVGMDTIALGKIPVKCLDNHKDSIQNVSESPSAHSSCAQALKWVTRKGTSLISILHNIYPGALLWVCRLRSVQEVTNSKLILFLTVASQIGKICVKSGLVEENPSGGTTMFTTSLPAWSSHAASASDLPHIATKERAEQICQYPTVSPEPLVVCPPNKEK